MGNGIQANKTQEKIIISNSLHNYISQNISNLNINNNIINNLESKVNEETELKTSSNSSQLQSKSINSLNIIKPNYNHNTINKNDIQNCNNNQVNPNNINGILQNSNNNNQNKIMINGVIKSISAVISVSYFGYVTSRVLYHHYMPNGLFDFVASRFRNSTEQLEIAKKIIELLPVYELKEKNNDSCAICVSDFEIGDKVTTIPCSHLFHSECIKEWLKINLSCPICKFGLKLSSFAGN